MARAVSSIPSARSRRTVPAQARGLAHQGLQRGLEPMGKIGGAGTCAPGLGVPRGQQVVDFRRHRAQFHRPVVAHALRPPVRNAAIRAPRSRKGLSPTDSCAHPAAISASASNPGKAPGRP
jgi:hypothetical protein